MAIWSHLDTPSYHVLVHDAKRILPLNKQPPGYTVRTRINVHHIEPVCQEVVLLFLVVNPCSCLTCDRASMWIGGRNPGEEPDILSAQSHERLHIPRSQTSNI